MQLMAHPTPAAPTTVQPTPTDRGFRPDIQGLRAIAVMVVVLYHLWPTHLTGGYVGVDVFFVISGFLITGHLWREIETRGTIRLGSFYARRALRLLPAAGLVLVATAVAGYLLLPDDRWADTFKQLVASAAYVQNWVLAGNSVDYLLQNAPDSPVQHFWSLSVEEQFYAFWPLLILVTMRLVRRKQAVVAVLSALLLVSLAYSVYQTGADPKQAYFITPTRVWEFAAGALCALVTVKARAVWGWLGLAAVLASAVLYTKATAFPGYAALLPVLGTAALILARPEGRGSVGRWLSLRPATAIGDISYAVYLWHWPLLLLLPLALEVPLALPAKVAVLAATLLLAWLSTHYFETPLRASRALKVRRWPSLAIAVSLVAAMFAASVQANAELDDRAAEAAASYTSRLDEAGGGCIGAAVFTGTDCAPPFGPGPRMSATLAVKDQSNPEYTACDPTLDTRHVLECSFGPKDAAYRVAVVGDSHATQWLGTLRRLADENRLRVKTYFKMSCPFAEAIRVLPREAKERQDNCTAWQEEVTSRIVDDPEIDYVLVTAYSAAYRFEALPGRPALADQNAAFIGKWQRLLAAGKRVVVLRDTPSMLGKSIPSCVEKEQANLRRCAVARDKALKPDLISAAAAALGDPRVTVMDLSDGLCDAQWCYGFAGDVVVYRDSNHLTWQYAQTLAPAFWQAFVKAAGPLT
ncbi:acyltransferase family protein [Catellatospora aurea]|uniref:Acyltransferase family protein n=1 Tax=Catellatospora aurea TaxID=1337874 RepID=A0ABW2GUC8_9ACTN